MICLQMSEEHLGKIVSDVMECVLDPSNDIDEAEEYIRNILIKEFNLKVEDTCNEGDLGDESFDREVQSIMKALKSLEEEDQMVEANHDTNFKGGPIIRSNTDHEPRISAADLDWAFTQVECYIERREEAADSHSLAEAGGMKKALEIISDTLNIKES